MSGKTETLWDRAISVATRALAAGRLMPIVTDAQRIEEEGISYFAHVVTANATKKCRATSTQGNPFLPYEQSLYVDEVGQEHVCLLNKFPVLTPHLLICSKTFIPQQSCLTLSDFQAWLAGFDYPDVFGFYNSGPQAGASQAHRHMQLVRSPIPLEKVISQGELPFVHCLALLHTLEAADLYRHYLSMMAQLGLLADKECGDCAPYNLLLTERWMLLFPRSKNNIEGVFANGINYSGRFLVKQAEQLEWLQQYGLMNYLTNCSRHS
ncbi:DUF4922 domain-containing protein [Photobacterium lutimaris]|uniref:Phosphorylase n=1 Tax=Photobacterium lutimaris TaxID=388278 RepID=A0A2T3J1I2_9GAMM|nr:DUF4922 domain-containing protein [Photobacterium lutimaris]PSU34941.1 phosphorylase [Photobacterium lutimaris]TDR77295.1 ATP adenylyltransferase [Photobacterium lutimaris]